MREQWTKLAWIALAIMLIVVGCSPSATQSPPTPAPTTVPPTQPPSPTATIAATVPNGDYAKQTQAIVEKWITAYQERDAEALLSLYSNDITGTDCSGVGCVTFNLSELKTEVPWTFRDPTFKVKVNSYVVTSVGVFATVQATYEYGSVGPTTPVAATIILEFKDGKILNEIWYY